MSLPVVRRARARGRGFARRDRPLGTRRVATAASIAAACGLAAFVAAFITTWPVVTKQGVNYEVTDHRIPLYLKAWEFVDRSVQYQQVADEITSGAVSDTDRVLKVFDWTKRRIKTTPDGWPVVDDHILNIIIRGHGVGDQQADVFAAITTYAGVSAFWQKVPFKRPPGVILSFAFIDDRWRVFDIARGIVFRTAAGELATMEDLAHNRELVPASVRSLDVDGVTYAEIVTNASMPPVPHPLRAELQMPLPRLWHEVKAAVGIEPDDDPKR